MTPTDAEIHDEVQKQFQDIRRARRRLEELRAACRHPKRHVAYWEWGGPGRMYPAKVCDVCLGDPIALKDQELQEFYRTEEATKAAAFARLGLEEP